MEAPKRQSFILRTAFTQIPHSSHTINMKTHWPLRWSAGLRDGRWLRWATLGIRVNHRCDLLPVPLDLDSSLQSAWKWWSENDGHLTDALLRSTRDGVDIEEERNVLVCHSVPLWKGSIWWWLLPVWVPGLCRTVAVRDREGVCILWPFPSWFPPNLGINPRVSRFLGQCSNTDTSLSHPIFL